MTAAILVASVLLHQQVPPRRAAGPLPTPEAVAVDTGALRHSNGRPPPYAEASRIRGAPPRVDGDLSDPAWAAARPVTEFTQDSPLDGEPCTERTEVRILYDDEAIYVGARMLDSEPALVRAQLGRRDTDAPADAFWANFDSYHDHRTSFGFGVSAAGGRLDMARSNDQAGGDLSWNPVWDVATGRDSLGWTAEMRIPLSQLRYPRAAAQVWGVHFRRWIQRKAESAEFGWSSQTDAGFASWFGHLHGLRDLPRPGRLELLPYATAREERIEPAGGDADPFNDGSRERLDGGLDLQYGLASNLTLNATLNPDFGQVEADPAEINLTAYETLLSERRPFFVEGASVFTGFGSGGSIRIGGAQLFYSRRIGRPPQGSAGASGWFVDAPATSTILGAAKLSGRTAGGWSIGVLEALTARQFAAVDSAGIRSRDEIEPLTNFVIVRGRRDFRRGSSTIGFVATGVARDLRDSRLDFLRSSAYAGGVDLTHRFDRNRFTLWGSAAFSHVRGDERAIRLAQRSSARYFQRPDAHHVWYDSTLTALSGWTATAGVSKDAGDWVYGITSSVVSPGFEVNDLGYQTSADDIIAAAFAIRRWTRPGSLFRYSYVQALGYAYWNFGFDRTSTTMQLYAYGQFLNYWAANLRMSVSPRSVNDGLTRGGPRGLSPASVTVGGGLGSDFRSRIVVSGGMDLTRNDLRGWSVSAYGSVEARPTSSVSLSVGPSFYAGRYQQQYAFSVADTTATATFGRRYVFGEYLQRTLDFTTRINVALTPDLSFQLYAQPFVGSGDFRRLKQLLEPRTTHYADYPDESPDDFDFASRSLRGNAVLRWEYRPGSTLFLVWTTRCSAGGGDSSFRPVDGLRHLCQGPSDNVFAVKLNYWLNL